MMMMMAECLAAPIEMAGAMTIKTEPIGIGATAVRETGVSITATK